MKIYDITLPLKDGIPVWPGDVAFRRNQSLWIEKGDWVSLSSIECSLHTGTHADAPSHYREGAPGIGEVDLRPYLGPARVLRLDSARVGAIGLEEIGAALDEGVQRLLVCSNPGIPRDRFPEAFRHLSVEAAEALGSSGVLLFGTDAPSVDAVDSKDLPVHKTFGRCDVRILENLSLSQVSAGEYELIALPLRIDGGDGSPVRAVLRGA